MSDPGASYLHLNRDGLWPGFAWRGLVADSEGSLNLADLPRLDSDPALREQLAASPAPDGPAGLAVAPDGTVLWSDPGGGRVLRRLGCDGHVGPLPLPADAGPLGEPRGLAVHRERNALWVADAAGDRLLAFALSDHQLLAVWGGSGTELGRFDRPLAVTAGGEGAIYVADSGNGRIQKLAADGTSDAGFAGATAAAGLTRPAAVSWDGHRLLVLDLPAAAASSQATARLLAFAAGGSLLAERQLGSAATLGLAAGGGAVYLGDNTARRIGRLDADGATLGSAVGYAGPVAALAVDGDDLWSHPGGAAIPVRLDRRGAHSRHGVLWGGPIEVDGQPHRWHRLAVRGELPEGVAVSLWASPGDGGPPPDPDPGRLDEPTGGFDPAAWRLLAPGTADALAGSTSPRLWVAAQVIGDGTATPRIDQLRLAFDHDGYEEHLPAIYRVPEKALCKGEPPDAQSLIRFLALFESFFADTEEEIGDLRLLLDPATTPPDWLGWLSGWLAFAAEEGWPADTARRLLADAFEASAWRGTARGLRRALADRLGVDAVVEEPHAQADWWMLPAAPACSGEGTTDCGCGDGCGGEDTRTAAGSGFGARLGLTTRLVSAPPEGAVAGVSAVLDGSHLLEPEDFGEPLFTPTAYRFTVRVPRSQVSAPAARAAAQALIEREKPAHTDYRLCLVEPGTPLGSRTLGVDTLLGGGPPSASRLGEPGAGAGAEPLLALAGEATGRLGDARLGNSARLGAHPAGGAANRRTTCNQPAAAGSATAREEESWARS